jgi:hypothetical protein
VGFNGIVECKSLSKTRAPYKDITLGELNKARHLSSETTWFAGGSNLAGLCTVRLDLKPGCM